MQTDRSIHLQNSWTKSQSTGRCVGAVVYLFPITENSKKNLLPIFLYPSWSSAFWDMTLRVINARSTCFPRALTKCFTVLAALASAAIYSGCTSISFFILSFDFPFFPLYWVIYYSEWCVEWETDVTCILHWHSCPPKTAYPTCLSSSIYCLLSLFTHI